MCVAPAVIAVCVTTDFRRNLWKSVPTMMADDDWRCVIRMLYANPKRSYSSDVKQSGVASVHTVVHGNIYSTHWIKRCGMSASVLANCRWVDGWSGWLSWLCFECAMYAYESKVAYIADIDMEEEVHAFVQCFPYKRARVKFKICIAARRKFVQWVATCFNHGCMHPCTYIII